MLEHIRQEWFICGRMKKVWGRGKGEGVGEFEEGKGRGEKEGAEPKRWGGGRQVEIHILPHCLMST